MDMFVRLLLCGLLVLCTDAGARERKKGKAAEVGARRNVTTAPQITLKPAEVRSRFLVYRDGDSVETLCPITLLQGDSLLACGLNSSLPLAILLHGWSMSGVMESWLVQLAAALRVHVKEMNVVVCNWIPLAHELYPIAARNTQVVGQEVALFLDWLEDMLLIPPSKVHLIGFSLGAHAAGLVGTYFKGKRKLGRITGLDPAGPMFTGTPAWKRLSQDDAHFVDVIHSSSSGSMALGISQPLGHLDVYPNAGAAQPGCNMADILISKLSSQAVTDMIKCAHRRSIDLFVDSLLHSHLPLTAFRCRDNEAFEQGRCLDCARGRCNTLGYKAHRDPRRSGHKFYLRTTSQMPYRVFHFQLSLRVQSSTKSGASATVSLVGQQGQSQGLVLNLPAELKANETVSFLLTSASALGQLEGIKLHWEHQGALMSVWNRFMTMMDWGSSSAAMVTEATPLEGAESSLSLGKIRIKAGETQEVTWFCPPSSEGTPLYPLRDYYFKRCGYRQLKTSSREV